MIFYIISLYASDINAMIEAKKIELESRLIENLALKQAEWEVQAQLSILQLYEDEYSQFYKKVGPWADRRIKLSSCENVPHDIFNTGYWRFINNILSYRLCIKEHFLSKKHPISELKSKRDEIRSYIAAVANDIQPLIQAREVQFSILVQAIENQETLDRVMNVSAAS